MTRRVQVEYRTSKHLMLALGFHLLAASAQFPTAVPRGPADNSKPRVFVYDLPIDLTDGVPTRDDRQCDELASGSPELLDCLFGAEFTVQTELGPLTLRKTDQFAMGRIFLWRIMGSANRVDHPDEADLFFVPFWYADAFPKPTTCPTASEMFGQLHHLDPTTVSKHIFLSPRVAHDGDVCPFWWGHPWHRGMLKNKVDYHAPVNEKLAAGHMNSVMKLALEDRDCCWWAVGENTHSIPYPGFGSGLNPDMTQTLWQLREPNRNRPILAMGAFGIHGDHKEHSKSLREMLAVECKAHGPPICSGVVLTVVQKPGHKFALSDHTFKELVTTMLKSRFCFQPTGDTPSRKGIVDSILLGCIPVLFSTNQTRLWSWNIPDLSSISVLLDIAQGSPIDQLKKLDAARVTQLRQGVAKTAKHLAYTIQEGTGDAVEAALLHAWIHSGGIPEERQVITEVPVLSTTAQLSLNQQTQKVVRYDVPAHSHEVTTEKSPEHQPGWSVRWPVVLVCICSIVIGVGICVMVLQACPKSKSESKRFLGKRAAATSEEQDQKTLLPSNKGYRM